MTGSGQIDGLQAKVADRKNRWKPPGTKQNQQIKARPTSAEAKVRAPEETTQGQAAQVHPQWQSFKADGSAKMQELRGRINANAKSTMWRRPRKMPSGPRTRIQHAGLCALGRRPGSGGGAGCRPCSRMGRRAKGSLAV